MPKVVLITGASSGLGASIAAYLSVKGHIVYGASRSLPQGSTAFKPLVMDVCSEKSIQGAVDAVIRQEGRIDVLINNAGLGIAGPVENLSVSDVQRVFDTNLFGLLRTCQAVLPGMRANKSGLIINISSIGSETGLPYRGAYSASKAAVDRLTEAMRMELAPFGIQACYLQPGGIRTDINKNRITTALPSGNAYKESFDRCYAIVNASVSQGLDTELFGPVVERIMSTKKVKRFYRIGKPMEKISVFLKRALSDTMYEKLISNHYKV
ncbi:MAG TPA: SDR family oxidoreductase [Chitinophagaceae bacterium]|jgi:NAD(P)-dependent dehydrogenase (short-subunit alcohol dehydrogenase family)